MDLETKEIIRNRIRASIGYLDDVLDDNLQEILDKLGIKGEDALLYAREIYFGGWFEWK